MAKRDRPISTKQTGDRPVLQFRVHLDIYEALKKSAKRKKLTISEDAAKRIGLTISMDEQGLTPEAIMEMTANEFLMGRGYTKVRDEDGHELWAKGAAVAKYMAFSPEIEAAIERVVLRALQKAREQ
jgi:hypothetical protein